MSSAAAGKAGIRNFLISDFAGKLWEPVKLLQLSVAFLTVLYEEESL